MAKEKFKEWRPQAEKKEILDHLAEVIRDYRMRGFYPLSLRQIYYQAVARGYIPNTEQSYNNMSYLVKRARESGLWDWDDVEDRNRSVIVNNHFDDPRDLIACAANSYKIDKREDQPYYIECWVEKAALIGVIEPVARRFDVPCFACRGFVSATANHEAADRFKEQAGRDRRIIIYAGDYDPCGFSIHESIADRMKMFGADVELLRIGLNEEQIAKYNPPPAPVKESDSRARGFIEERGSDVWELDALDPEVIADLYREQIVELTDFDLFRNAERREERERSMVREIGKRWDELFQAC